jgi:hypothetical protein
VSELEKLLGKCARLGEWVNWIYHLMTHMYSSAAFALRENQEFLGKNSRNFQSHIKPRRLGTGRRVKEWLTLPLYSNGDSSSRPPLWAAVLHQQRHEEQDWVPEGWLNPDSGVRFESPIAHMIKHDPSAVLFTNAYLKSRWGYSLDKDFLFALFWRDKIVKLSSFHLQPKGQAIHQHHLPWILHVRTA